MSNAKIKKRFPKGKDITGEFLRSAGFTLNNYKDIKKLELEVFVSSQELNDYKKRIVAPLFLTLNKNANNKSI